MRLLIGQPLNFSYIGEKLSNEDCIYPLNPTYNSRLFIVCDGIGGWDKGEEASKLVCEALYNYFEQNSVAAITEEYLAEAVTGAHLVLAEYLNQNPLVSRMGTTLALLYIDSGGVFIAHLGDSRVYHIRNGTILFQTQDHKYVYELVAEGIITAEQAKNHPRRNVLSRSIGVKANAGNTKIDLPSVTKIEEIKAGDYFFLCSDGVFEHLDNQLLVDILMDKGNNIQKMSQIIAICEDKTNDNYSAYLIPIDGVVANEEPIQLSASNKHWSLLNFSFIFFYLISIISLAQNGTTYAVVVGIADYKILDYRSGDLRYADKDAERVVDLLMSGAGGNIPQKNIRLIVNNAATKTAILNAMQLFKRAQPQDRVIFYFSGHGLDGAFLPYDITAENINSILTHKEVKDYFKSSRASTKLCIADACLSGSMKTSSRKMWDVSDNTNSERKPANIALILSSRSTQSSIESGVTRGGIFTFFLLNGLRGKADFNQDNIVTIQELYRYVAPLVKRNTPNKQVPIFYGNFSNDLPVSYPQ